METAEQEAQAWVAWVLCCTWRRWLFCTYVTEGEKMMSRKREDRGYKNQLLMRGGPGPDGLFVREGTM